MRLSDIGKHKGYHDKRVQNNRTTGPEPEINFSTGFECLDLNRKRMSRTLPGNTLGDSFIAALDTAEGAELFSVWEKKDKDIYKVILKNLKDDWQKDSKFISALPNVGFELGNTITWTRLNIRWLIVWQDYNIQEYFRGEIQKATHLIRWKNKNGVIKEQWGVVQGPVETRAKFEQTTGNVIVGKQNDTLEILIGSNDKENIRELKRFDKIKVGNKVWKIQVVDDISSENIMRFTCVEDFSNMATDDLIEGIPNGLVDFAKNEKDPIEEESIRIVGPTKVKEKLVSTFYAVNSKEEKIIGDWEVENSGGYSLSDPYTLSVKGQKIGLTIKITFTDSFGRKNSISVKTVSMMS